MSSIFSRKPPKIKRQTRFVFLGGEPYFPTPSSRNFVAELAPPAPATAPTPATATATAPAPAPPTAFPPAVFPPTAFPPSASVPTQFARLRGDLGYLIAATYMPLETANTYIGNRGYKIDTDLSDDDTMVFIDTSGKAVIGHRGSHTTRDWMISNPLVGMGFARIDPRHIKAQDITARVQAKYGPADAIGHSLGGRLAEESGALGTIMTYNKAAGLGDLLKRPVARERQLDIRTSWDLPSTLSQGQPRKVEYISHKRRFLFPDEAVHTYKNLFYV